LTASLLVAPYHVLHKVVSQSRLEKVVPQTGLARTDPPLLFSPPEPPLFSILNRQIFCHFILQAFRMDLLSDGDGRLSLANESQTQRFLVPLSKDVVLSLSEITFEK